MAGMMAGSGVACPVEAVIDGACGKIKKTHEQLASVLAWVPC